MNSEYNYFSLLANLREACIIPKCHILRAQIQYRIISFWVPYSFEKGQSYLFCRKQSSPANRFLYSTLQGAKRLKLSGPIKLSLITEHQPIVNLTGKNYDSLCICWCREIRTHFLESFWWLLQSKKYF